MLLKISEFRRRIDDDLDNLIVDLQALTHRHTFEEEQAWRSSLPQVSKAFSAKSFENLDLFFGSHGNLALEYNLPGGTGWADMVLLGKHKNDPAAVIVELKNWITKGDLPGPTEGLMERHGQVCGHPADQVRGYTEWCRNFHSTVQERSVRVHGCVIFTKDSFYHSYGLAPNDSLTNLYPCFSVDRIDVQKRLPEFFKDRLTEPDADFAKAFEKGAYKQSRGFVQIIGEQILNKDRSPFVLLDGQRTAFALVKARVTQAVTGRVRPKKTVILIEGPPGSGKSVVAAKVWASLVTNSELPNGNIVVVTTSSSQRSNWQYLFKKASGQNAAQGAVVPATNFTPVTNPRFGKLAQKYPDAFKPESLWRHNMEMLRSLQPEFRSGARDDEFLVSIVDEAHALINPEHPDGRGPFGFELKLGPQAYQIIRSSVVTVFLLDSQQAFRDRENTSVSDIKQWAGELGVEVFEEISLAGGQFRCAGSKDYVDWVDAFLRLTPRKTNDDQSVSSNVIPLTHRETSSPLTLQKAAEQPPKYIAGITRQAKRFVPFEFEVFDHLVDLEAALRKQMEKGYTARFLSTYARKWKTEGAALPHNIGPELMDFHEPYEHEGETKFWSKVWNYVPKGNDYTHFIQAPIGSKMMDDPLCEVGCPYAVRGFDFDYVGLLWLSDLKLRSGEWTTDTGHVFERGMKRRIAAAKKEKALDGPAHIALLEGIKEAYRILLTRPMKGLFLWCEDVETREYLISCINK
jgi:hypothetical protein